MIGTLVLLVLLVAPPLYIAEMWLAHGFYRKPFDPTDTDVVRALYELEDDGEDEQ